MTDEMNFPIPFLTKGMSNSGSKLHIRPYLYALMLSTCFKMVPGAGFEPALPGF